VLPVDLSGQGPAQGPRRAARDVHGDNAAGGCAGAAGAERGTGRGHALRGVWVFAHVRVGVLETSCAVKDIKQL